MGGLALGAALLILVGAPPAGAGLPAVVAEAVKVTKTPANVQHRTFDPRRPPKEMPQLKPPEAAICAANFLSSTGLSGHAVQTDATHAKFTIDRIEVTLQLNITIWLPPNPPRTIAEHEEGHRQIAEYFYENADAIAKRLAQPYVGKTIELSGRDLQESANMALKRVGTEISEALNKEMPIELAEVRFDAITDHGLKSIPVPKAVAQAIRETTLILRQPMTTPGKK